MKNSVPTLIVAPDELSRAGLLAILAGARFKPIPAKVGWEAAFASGKPPPGVVVLILIGTMTDPVAIATQIETMAARARVIVLADHCEAKLVRSAMCAGAVAYLPRSVTIETLLCALELAVRGEVVFPASVARAILSCAQPEQEPQPILTDASGDNGNSNNAVFSMSAERMGRLSSREIEILKRLVAGDSNKQISRQLDISETTVKVHVKAILRKVRVRNRTQAAIWGIARLPNLAGRSASTLSDVSPRIATEASSVPKAILPIVANVQP